MLILKIFLLLIIFILSTIIGIAIAKMYENRVKELQEFKGTLNAMTTKIKFTYEPGEEIFIDISKNDKNNISKIFKQMSEQIKYRSVEDVWTSCIQNADISIKQEDKNILKRLGKLLGQTDVEGQISEIEVTQSFLENQITKAEEERNKNQKMYKTLGAVVGLTFVVILI